LHDQIEAVLLIHKYKVALLNFSGTVVERYEYDAYGNCHILEPNFDPDPDGESDYSNPYLFTGRAVDILDNSSLKIQYNRNRYCDQYTGRWTTQDPLGVAIGVRAGDMLDGSLQYIDGLNLYQYSSSQPTGAVDFSGLWDWRVHWRDTIRAAWSKEMCFHTEIGNWDNGVDKGYRHPKYGSVLSSVARLLGGVGGFVGGTVHLNTIAYWHFPGADRGQAVLPGSAYAKREIEKGLSRCNLKIFSEGLHQLQDSYSHQSGIRLPPWLGKVGHARDRYGWYWQAWNNPLANPWASPGMGGTVRALQRICRPICTRTQILQAARKVYTMTRQDADDYDIFETDYESAFLQTQQEMQRFIDGCPCIKDGPHKGECIICRRRR
jgi:RHS repeat-associated protein